MVNLLFKFDLTEGVPFDSRPSSSGGIGWSRRQAHVLYMAVEGVADVFMGTHKARQHELSGAANIDSLILEAEYSFDLKLMLVSEVYLYISNSKLLESFYRGRF